MKGFVNLTHTNNKKIEDLRKLVEQKQDATPSGNIPIINEETGKIDNAYIPTNISGGRRFAGTFNENGIITSSEYLNGLNGKHISEVEGFDFVGCEFLYTGNEQFELSWGYYIEDNIPTTASQKMYKKLVINTNDLIIYNGETTEVAGNFTYINFYSWMLIDNSDKVVSVNGQTGAVELNFATLDDVNNAIGNVSSLLGDTEDLEV